MQLFPITTSMYIWPPPNNFDDLSLNIGCDNIMTSQKVKKCPVIGGHSVTGYYTVKFELMVKQFLISSKLDIKVQNKRVRFSINDTLTFQADSHTSGSPIRLTM